ncbi:hypothetical protein CCP2SC5_100051 [Azospirillaceae bacterium]
MDDSGRKESKEHAALFLSLKSRPALVPDFYVGEGACHVLFPFLAESDHGVELVGGRSGLCESPRRSRGDGKCDDQAG